MIRWLKSLFGKQTSCYHSVESMTFVGYGRITANDTAKFPILHCSGCGKHFIGPVQEKYPAFEEIKL